MPTPSSPWKPTASLSALQKRSRILAEIRAFFAARKIWEVETPLLAASTASDPHIASFAVALASNEMAYLQTSPEFAMKRLLAAGSGSIYQLSKAFRSEEQGRLHSREFTMLEWYRVGFDHHQLMDEMDALLHLVLKTPPAERCSYRALFLQYVDIDPLVADAAALEKKARQQGIGDIHSTLPEDIDFWRHVLMSHCIEPHLGKERPLYVTDFPASQAALAKIHRDENGAPVAARFEVYFRGIELANGYHELCDPIEQEKRFVADMQRRALLQLPAVPLDTQLLAALAQGFPDCAGVALGIDRLVMLALDKETIGEVMPFL